MTMRLLHIYILYALSALSLNAQEMREWNITLLKQQNLGTWAVPAGNYSGITYLGGNEFAVVSDSEATDGFFTLTLQIDPITGSVLQAGRSAIKGAGLGNRDAEDIAYNPSTKTLFVVGEKDQKILEYSIDGTLTGRQVTVPQSLSSEAIYPNYGFESLAYSPAGDLLWTVTEHTLRADGRPSDATNAEGCKLRLQSFDGTTLKPVAQYAYITDTPTAHKLADHYAFGVSALTAMEDGSLLVLEREFYVAEKQVGSYVRNKIYRVIPALATPLSDQQNLSTLTQDQFMRKALVADFTTKLGVSGLTLANYEGMCLGPKLADGSQTLILISDSQNNYGNKLFHLKDYVKVIKIKE